MIKFTTQELEMEKDKKALEIASKKSIELDKSTTDIKDTVNDLKKTPIVKKNYTISEDDKNKILEYIDKVDKTIKDLKEDYNWSKEYDKNEDHDDFEL